jgi:hypothetical protein
MKEAKDANPQLPSSAGARRQQNERESGWAKTGADAILLLQIDHAVQHAASDLGRARAGNAVHADEQRQARLIRRIEHQDIAVAGRTGFVDAGGRACFREGRQSVEIAADGLRRPELGAESHATPELGRASELWRGGEKEVGAQEILGFHTPRPT